MTPVRQGTLASMVYALNLCERRPTRPHPGHVFLDHSTVSGFCLQVITSETLVRYYWPDSSPGKHVSDRTMLTFLTGKLHEPRYDSRGRSA
jgi:hypothetical protein